MHSALKHYASPQFWRCHHSLPAGIRALADKNFALLKSDPNHPSLHLKSVGEYWSVRVGMAYRALGATREGGILWFWICSHAEYDKLIAPR